MVTSPLLHDVENLRHKWGWLLTLGIVMILLGSIALVIMPAGDTGYNPCTRLALGS
jgi:uncharacterized membrane protein HdeD (DUF308 family)